MPCRLDIFLMIKDMINGFNFKYMNNNSIVYQTKHQRKNLINQSVTDLENIWNFMIFINIMSMLT